MMTKRNDPPPKRITIVCQVFYPDTQSTSQLLSDLCRLLAKRGFSIRVLCGFPGVGEDLLPRREIWNEIEIHRGGVRTPFKKSLWLRFLSYITYTWFVTWQLICASKLERVFVVTNPPFMPVVAGAVCLMRRISFVSMLQDVYPDGLIALGKTKERSLVARLWRSANRKSLNGAYGVWVIGRDMKALVAAQYSVSYNKMTVVPHWSPVEFTIRKEPECSGIWRQWKLKEKCVIQYSGNMGLWHDIDTIVDAASRLRHIPVIHFVLIGDGIRRGAAVSLARQLGLSNISWFPYQLASELHESLLCCHAALISQRTGLEGVAVPCKLYGILASGRAVVAQVPANSEVAMVVEEEHCGVVVPPGDAQGLADVILRLARDAAETERMGAAAFAAYRKKYTLEAGVAAFEDGWNAWLNGAEVHFAGAESAKQ